MCYNFIKHRNKYPQYQPSMSEYSQRNYRSSLYNKSINILKYVNAKEDLQYNLSKGKLNIWILNRICTTLNFCIMLHMWFRYRKYNMHILKTIILKKNVYCHGGWTKYLYQHLWCLLCVLLLVMGPVMHYHVA